jgi:coenzyme F420-0:L-glutamate ligase / coenzyme F420-1:gamma-L-glutamate ligase
MAGGPPPGTAPGEPGARLIAVPLPPLPDVRPGDDLATLIADALRAGAAADAELEPRPGDVLVVTQKVVSKAEGRIVDLRSVRPRAEAVVFARRWDRDARQVEVVLRESARVVRMDRGVIVSRTTHGYVCANAGVDASNTDSPDLVTLLPEDPDRSARGIRERLRALIGLDLAVVVADSFGRPWRWGITDVALGVSGFAPLADFRGMADTAGRQMHATVVAVADEICAAAELASGKTSRRPVVLVRGAPLPAGDGSVAGDVLMPEAFDLFP